MATVWDSVPRLLGTLKAELLVRNGCGGWSGVAAGGGKPESSTRALRRGRERGRGVLAPCTLPWEEGVNPLRILG